MPPAANNERSATARPSSEAHRVSYHVVLAHDQLVEVSTLSETPKTVTRRTLLQSAPSVAALLVPAAAWSQRSMSSGPAHGALDLPVLAQPDLVFAFIGDAEAERHALSRTR